MGILKGFLNDIFVSYGRGPQNAEGYAQERTRLLAEWSLQLVRHIKYQLQLEMPQDADLKLWVDTGLDQTIALEDSLKNNVQGSAILLVIMSNFYLQSEYCMFETSYFKSTPLDTAPKPNQVVIISAQKTDRTRWPQAFKSSTGSTPPSFPFYRQEDSQDEDEFSPFGWGGQINNDDYWGAIRKVTHALRKKIIELKSNEPGSLIRSPNAGATVFLGYMNEMMQTTHNEIRSQLSTAGLIVLPENTPVDDATLSAHVARDLDKCQALVVASNEYCGLWPSNEPAGYVGKQFRVAAARGVPVFFWYASGGAAPQSFQNSAYENLVAAQQQNDKVTFSSSAAFCDHILDRISAKQIKMTLICSNLRKSVPPYADFDLKISKAIQKTRRFAINVNSTSSRGQIKLVDLDSKMENTDSVVLVCYDQEFWWAAQMIGELHKLSNLNRQARTRLVIVGPEVTIESKINIEGLNFDVIEGASIGPEILEEKLVSLLQ
jgi:hypothetical protein